MKENKDKKPRKFSVKGKNKGFKVNISNDDLVVQAKPFSMDCSGVYVPDTQPDKIYFDVWE